jgi:hypothetical protein
MNIVLITSIILTPNTPLSYTPTRSIYTREERYAQTKNTIESVKRIPNKKTIMIECSDLSEEEESYFKNNVDIFINLYKANNQGLVNNIHSASKSLGEGTMTIVALNYLLQNNIDFKYLFKLSGRYALTDKFNYDIYDNNNILAQYYCDNFYASTILYKLPYDVTKLWLIFLNNSMELFLKCEGYERIFSLFLSTIKSKDRVIDCKTLGVCGNVSVSGGYVEG